MKLYVSGPIKGQDNPREVFALAVETLRRRGYDTLNPFDIEPHCTCPPGSDLTDSSPHYNCFMRGDLRDMVTCDGVALLSGWQHSKGALLEQFVALSVGIPVMSVGDWCKAAPR